jgi:hypothetical protein
MSKGFGNNILISLFGFIIIISSSFCPLVMFAQSMKTAKTKMTSLDAYKNGFAHNVMRTPSENGVQLNNYVLFENDGPGAGASEKGPYTDAIYEGVLARKQFYLKDPRAKSAYIVLYLIAKNQEQGKPTPYYIIVNGTKIFGPPTSWGGSDSEDWRWVKVPIYLLKKGLNQVIVGCDSPKSKGYYSLLFARADEYASGGGKYTYKGNTAMISADQIRPDSGEGGGYLKHIKVGATSAKSDDGGKTWVQGKLGPNNNISGEYTIRLHMKRFHRRGTLSSPPIDLWTDKKDSVITPKTQTKNVKINVLASVPDSTDVTWQIRTSNTNDMLNDSAWNQWETLGSGSRGIFYPGINGHRFIQWRAVLRTKNPLNSPIIKEVDIQRHLSRKPVSKDTYYVINSANSKIRYSSYRMTYQNSKNKLLELIRKRLNLDSVLTNSFSNKEHLSFNGMGGLGLKGPKSVGNMGINEGMHKQEKINIIPQEFNFYKINQLRKYVSNLWKYSAPLPDFPAWNTIDILNRKDKIGAGGFCLQFTITLMQALQSLGYIARHVNVYHHEPMEVYIDKLEKWVMVDPTFDDYEFNVKTGIPLNILEQHKYFLKEFGFSAQNPISWKSTKSWASYWGNNKLIFPEGVLYKKQPLDYSTFRGSENNPLNNLQPFLAHNLARFFRIIPRYDFLSRPTPRPLAQGELEWPWDGYLCWYDKATPRKLEYALQSDRIADFYPTLNTVQFTATYGKYEGDINILMVTHTPNFKTFEVNINGQGWESVPSEFTWHLLPSAINTLKMRTVNELGKSGKSSKLKVMWNYKAPVSNNKKG